MTDTNNITKAIHDAEQEHEKLLETLKGYEKTKLRVAQLESFISLGKTLLGMDSSTEEAKSSAQLSLLQPQEDLPALALSDVDLIQKPLKEGVIEILTESGKELSLAEIADGFRKRHWKLSEKNGRQVLRGTVQRFPELLTKTVRGAANTAYYKIKQG
jgi:hypothetical protein